MHVDASATVPFFVAPALAYVLPLDPNGLKDANIYVLINGQLGVIPHTTKTDAISILSRSLSAELNHMARTEIALTSEFARKYSMNFRLAVIPIDYPFSGPLDFQKSVTGELFNYGVECAREGRLWTTVEQAIAHSERALSSEVAKHHLAEGQTISLCPLDDSPIPTQTLTQPR